MATIRDRGATGNGTTDDTVAIQAALDDQARAVDGNSQTRRVVLSPGTYVVSQIVIPDNVAFVSGGGKLQHKAGATAAAVRMNGVNSILEGIEIDGNAANQTSNVNGIEVNGTRARVVGCYVHDTKYKAIAITSGGTYADITGNSVANAGHAGIDCVGGSWSTIHGNTVNTTGAAGIGVSGAALGVAVTGNTIRFSTLDGVVAYESTLRELSVVGNTIESPGNHGVHVGGAGLVVANNTIKSVLVGSGVFVRNHDSTTATDISFTGNTVRGAVMSGARVELAVNATVSGNSFTGCNDGIFVDTCTNFTAASNVIKNAGAMGVRATSVQNLSLTGNVMESSALDGIYILTTVGASVAGNVVGGTTGGRGIRLFQSERVTIDGNTVRNTSGEGIYAYDSATPASACRYVTVTGNTIHTTGGSGIRSTENSDYWTIGANTLAGVTGTAVVLVGSNNQTYAPAQATTGPLQHAPTGALAQTLDRRTVAGAALPVATSGTMRMSAVWLAKGTVVTSITYVAGTAATGLTNRWFALYDLSRNLLRTTADNTAVWSAGATLTLALSSTYTVPSDGLYYVGICEVATTPTALRGISASSNSLGISPPLNGDGSTGLTTAASTPTPGPSLSVSGNLPYAYVS